MLLRRTRAQCGLDKRAIMILLHAYCIDVQCFCHRGQGVFSSPLSGTQKISPPEPHCLLTQAKSVHPARISCSMMVALSVFERLPLICMHLCGATADDNRERSHTCGGQEHSRLQRDCGSRTGGQWAQRTYGLQGRGHAQGYCYQEGIQTRGAHVFFFGINQRQKIPLPTGRRFRNLDEGSQGTCRIIDMVSRLCMRSPL